MDFQLPLSGSLNTIFRRQNREAIYLSTPSLGITKAFK